MRFIKGFGYAFRGFANCISTQRNMRVHIVIAAYVLAFARFFQMTAEKWAALIIIISMVLCLEMINTAIENICDLYSTKYNQKIKIIKDIAAGTVFICSIASVAVAVFFFWQPDTWLYILMRLASNPLLFTFFILTVVFCILFIIMGPAAMFGKPKKNTKKERPWE